MATVLRRRVGEGIDVVTLNRPDRLNTLSFELIDELHAVLAACRHDRTCRVVVLTGAGPHFCAGLELRELDADPPGDTFATVQGQIRRQRRLVELITTIASMDQPVIAAVHGAAVGGGFALALAADIRLVTPDARLSAAFIKIGLSACELGVSWLLPRLVGASRASEILLTGRDVDGREADAIGLAQLAPDDRLEATAIEIAGQICVHSPLGVRMTKQVVRANLEVTGLSAGIELENRTQLLALHTNDHREAVAAFFEKRPPVFTDE
jgi:enoyl-CoA hydratase